MNRIQDLIILLARATGLTEEEVIKQAKEKAKSTPFTFQQVLEEWEWEWESKNRYLPVSTERLISDPVVAPQKWPSGRGFATR